VPVRVWGVVIVDVVMAIAGSQNRIND